MLSKADDYPIHQTPEPIAYSGTDRNFYDRYFFNGYSADGKLYFAAALGVYPHLNIMDAAFAVRIGERQYNLRASRHLNIERMDTQVGPIRVEVIEPLQRLRIVVEDNEHGLSADLIFEGRMAPFEEPRVTRRHGPRTIMDFARLTQFGRYSGWIRSGGKRIEAGENLCGVRDRSWGVRAIGERDSQAMVPAQIPHFHWFWTPLQFEDRTFLFFANEDEQGEVWHQAALIGHDVGRVEHFPRAVMDVTYASGTRWPTKGMITIPAAGKSYRVELEAGAKFFMTGIGYLDPAWAHGINKGPLAIGYDEIDTANLPFESPYIYVQSVAQARMTTPDGQVLDGMGTFEVLSMGPNAKRGFTGWNDGA
jgi:hypothetical protein